MTLLAKSSLYVLFFALLCFSALAREYSIMGYTRKDLTIIDKVINLFESWVSKHGKFYDSPEEKLHRLEIFKDNLKHIDETNKKVSNYWLGLNEFADLSHEEFKNMFLGLKGELPEKREESSKEFTYRDFVDLPKSLDWRKKGAVAPVKNQGSCELSEQELIDCDTGFNNGCNRGLMDYAFSFIVKNGGLHKEEEYPYIMSEGTCDEKKITISSLGLDKQTPQGSARTTSTVDLEEFCEKHYEKLLPIMADKRALRHRNQRIPSPGQYRQEDRDALIAQATILASSLG
ncbi:cysteine protease XCP1-like protein [Tanacetum coccineum]